jgi:site-specific recombinase XerD
VTLGAAVDGFILHCAHGQATDATKTSYRNALRRFLDIAGLTTLEAAEKLKSAQDVLSTLERDSEPATVAHTISVARQFYKHLKLSGRDVADPTFGLAVKHADNVPDWNVLHEGDSAKLLQLVKAPRDRAVLLALILQGWRVSELANMQWRQLRETKTGWEVEWKAKGRKLRVQGLQASVLEAIRALGGREKPSDPLIPKSGQAPLTRKDIYRIVTKYSKAFGRRVSPHGLRATYISSVISRKGIDAAKQLAGHKDISTTQRYSRWVVNRDDPLTVEDM